MLNVQKRNAIIKQNKIPLQRPFFKIKAEVFEKIIKASPVINGEKMRI